MSSKFSTPARAGYRRAVLISILATSILAGCAKSSNPAPTPTPLPTDLPKITCPAPPPVMTAAGQPVADVFYAAPTISGGTAPVTFKCDPPSPSTFAIGSTPVKCTATDAQQRADSCAFTVMLVPPPIPRLSVTSFVCFGDSMTEGSNAVLPRFIPSPPGSYPADVLALLAARYSAQTITVLDEGVPGEKVADGRPRLARVLPIDRPDALLLLEGVNDLNEFGADGIPSIVRGLQLMVQNARANGVVVFLATLPPQRQGAQRAFSFQLVEPLNQLIRSTAATEGAVLVDVYRDFNGQVDLLLDPDGLHPNAAGYQRMAESFFTAIRARLEVAPGPTPVVLTGRRPAPMPLSIPARR